MKQGKINGLTIEYFDGDITELPAKRFYLFQKYLLVDSGIGSTIEDYDRHMEKAMVYLKREDVKNARLELASMRENFHLLLQGVSPRHLAFCALVYSVNGEAHTDLSDEGNKRLHDRLSGQITKSWVDQVLEAIKKKLK